MAESTENALVSRLSDCLVGVAIGNAYGTSIWHKGRDWISANLTFSAWVNNVIVGTEDTIWSYKGYRLGDYTDSTEMTLGLIAATNLILQGSAQLTEETLINQWKKIYEDTKQKKGYGSIALVFEGKQSLLEVQQAQTNRKYPGNAPPMRSVPLGFLPHDRIYDFCRANTNATHPHPKGLFGSLCVAYGTEWLLKEENQQTHIIDYCLNLVKDVDQEAVELLTAVNALQYPPREEDYTLLCGVQPTTSFPEGIYGLPSDSMRLAVIALYIVKHETSAFAGLKAAMNVGGDVETLGAVVVGMLAVRFGLTSIPDFIVEKIENKTLLKQVAVSFAETLTKSAGLYR